MSYFDNNDILLNKLISDEYSKKTKEKISQVQINFIKSKLNIKDIFSKNHVTNDTNCIINPSPYPVPFPRPFPNPDIFPLPLPKREPPNNSLLIIILKKIREIIDIIIKDLEQKKSNLKLLPLKNELKFDKKILSIDTNFKII